MLDPEERPSQRTGHPSRAGQEATKCRESSREAPHSLATRGIIWKAPVPMLPVTACICLQTIATGEQSYAKDIAPGLVDVCQCDDPMRGRLPEWEIAQTNRKRWVVINE